MSSKMQYSIFNKRAIDATQEPLFLGESVNVSRYDIQHYPIFEKIIEKQTSFFWRPEEIDISKDRIDFQSLSDHEKHIFTSNLKYQTLLDSIQGRSPNIALLPLVSVPELETWIETWSYFETIHSRSYTHIIRNIYNDPSVVFDDIMLNEHIMKRASDIAKYYDDLIEYSQYYNLFGTGEFTVTDKTTGEQRTVSINLKELKKKLYMCIVSVYTLEAIRFYVSFACSFAFAERELMEGNAKIIKLVARDEVMHMSSTQHILSILSSDNEWTDVIQELSDEVTSLFKTVVEQEKEWAEYLFKDGSMIGLNKEILCQYIEYMANNRTAPLGIPVLYPNAKNNPIPWINAWLSSDNVQVAPQEVEITSYLVGQIDAEVNKDDLADFEL